MYLFKFFSVGWLLEKEGNILQAYQKLNKNIEKNENVRPNLEGLIENELRDAKVTYEKTKKDYWLGRYGAYYEIMKIYQNYNGKRLEFKLNQKERE